jgi:hypothetical protein
MRSLVSTILVRITWALTIAALLALSTSAGLFDLSRPAQAATAALSSPAGQRLASDFIADQLLVAVPGLSEKKAHDLATKVAADPGTLVALKQANLKSASAPQDRAALLDVVASQLKESNPKVAAATEKYAGQVQAAAASGQADPDSGALSQPPSPVGGILKRVRQFTGGASNVSAVMSDLKAQLAHTARVLAGLAILTALGALVFAPSRARVVRSFGWMFISISLIPAAIGWLVPDLVLARMSSDWAQALAVGLRVGGSRLIGLFVGLLCAGVVLLVLGILGPRIGSLLTPMRTPGERKPRPSAPLPPAARPQEAVGPPLTGQHFPAEPAITRPMEAVHHDDPGYATPPSGYPYPQSYPQSQPPPAFPGGQYPDYGPYGEQPTDQEPYGPPRDGSDRRR